MLVLQRRVGDVIVIADDIRVTVVAIRGDKVRIGIDAPRDIEVDREEVRAAKVRAAKDARPPGQR